MNIYLTPKSFKKLQEKSILVKRKLKVPEKQRNYGFPETYTTVYWKWDWAFCTPDNEIYEENGQTKISNSKSTI